MKRLNNLLSLHLQKILARDRGGGWPRAGSQLEPAVIGTRTLLYNPPGSDSGEVWSNPTVEFFSIFLRI